MLTNIEAGLEALGDGTRMSIFHRLASGPMAVSELAAGMPVSRPAVSQHLRVLKEAGLVSDSRDGTRRVYQLNPEGIALLRAHFDRMWGQAMRSFAESAESGSAETGKGEVGDGREHKGGGRP